MIIYQRNYKYEDKLSIFIDYFVKDCTDRIYTIFPKGNDAHSRCNFRII